MQLKQANRRLFAVKIERTGRRYMVRYFQDSEWQVAANTYATVTDAYREAEPLSRSIWRGVDPAIGRH